MSGIINKTHPLSPSLHKEGERKTEGNDKRENLDYDEFSEKKKRIYVS